MASLGSRIDRVLHSLKAIFLSERRWARSVDWLRRPVQVALFDLCILFRSYQRSQLAFQGTKL